VLRSILLCGLLAGACGGLLATGFARIVGEGPVGQAITYERAQSEAARAHDDAPVVSRALQSSLGLLTAALVYGLALGGIFALSFAAAYGRIARAGPARTSIWLAAAAFVVVYLVPFVKYPANPPAVGDPDTIGKRTGLYLIMILVSVVAAFTAIRLRALLRERCSGTAVVLLAGAAYLTIVIAAGFALPAVDEVPRTFPAVTLFRFREASIGMQATLWATIGLVFAGTAQRVMTGRSILPLGRRRSTAETASG
jgi:predicted cobalt transporter CbtA